MRVVAALTADSNSPGGSTLSMTGRSRGCGSSIGISRVTSDSTRERTEARSESRLELELTMTLTVSSVRLPSLTIERLGRVISAGAKEDHVEPEASRLEKANPPVQTGPTSSPTPGPLTTEAVPDRCEVSSATCEKRSGPRETEL